MAKISKQTHRIILTIAMFVAAISIVIAGYIWYAHNKQLSSQEVVEIPRYSQISDITFDDDKINIYLFWGNGCIHCEHLFEYLTDIWPEYSHYFNFYGFEIWDNQINGQIMDYFMEQSGQPTGQRSTPTLIIGDELFHGYSEDDQSKITDTIVSEWNDRANVQDFTGVLDLNLQPDSDTESTDNSTTSD